MTANSILAEFKAEGLRAGRSFDEVLRFMMEGRITQDAFECFCFLWQLSAFKFSAHYPVIYNAGDAEVFRVVASALGVALPLDTPRDLVLVNDDGLRVN